MSEPTTIRTQADADRLIPEMLRQPGPRVLRVVPSEAVDLTRIRLSYGWLDGLAGAFVLNGEAADAKPMSFGGGWSIAPAGSRITRVIVEGEAGPIHPAWIERLRDDCGAAGVPCELGSRGEWVPMRAIGQDRHDSIFRPAKSSSNEALQAVYDEFYGSICTVEQCVLTNDGERYDLDERSRQAREWGATDGGPFRSGRGGMQMFRIGRENSGQLLDGEAAR